MLFLNSDEGKKGNFWGAMYVFLFRKKKKEKGTAKKKEFLAVTCQKGPPPPSSLSVYSLKWIAQSYREKFLFFPSKEKESLGRAKGNKEASNGRVMNSRSAAVLHRKEFVSTSRFHMIFPLFFGITGSHISSLPVSNCGWNRKSTLQPDLKQPRYLCPLRHDVVGRARVIASHFVLATTAGAPPPPPSVTLGCESSLCATAFFIFVIHTSDCLSSKRRQNNKRRLLEKRMKGSYR